MSDVPSEHTHNKKMFSIVSKEMIKPSHPTPKHLNDEFKFSTLDKIIIPVYFPFIFFYQNTQKNHDDNLIHQNVQELKHSLSNVLTVYYPLAGQPENNYSTINCNDNGAEFVEARIHARLSDIIEDPNLDEMKQFVPLQLLSSKEEKVVLSVQVTLFDCGGMAIGVSLLHKVGDGKSKFGFMKVWSDTCRDQNQLKLIIPPKFDLVSHFPPGDDNINIPDDLVLFHLSHQKVVTKRLILDKFKISDLKAEIALNPQTKLKDPTRVEAASAFIWKQFIDQAKEKSFFARHVVDIRLRMSPPISETTFGNCILTSIANNEESNKLHELAYMLRKAIRKVDGDYIKQFQNVGEVINHLKELEKEEDIGMQVCSFSSWCRFPVYNVDYGWGKPVWVCTTPIPLKDFVVLMSTPCGEGVEALINILEDDI